MLDVCTCEPITHSCRFMLSACSHQAIKHNQTQSSDICSVGMVDPFSDGPSVTDMICSLDMYLQGCLLKIGVSDGTLSPEELYILTGLPDEFDEVCARNRGYKRFIKFITVESFKENSGEFYDFEKPPMFLETLIQDFDEAPMMVRSNLQIIFNAFIAIDGAFSDCEADVAIEILDKIDGSSRSFLKNNSNRKETKSESAEANPPLEKLFNSMDLHVESEYLESHLAELNDLVGLANVKNEVIACINLLRVNNMRKIKGLPELQTSNHMVFTGNPGTGKTTVARIMAKIYKCLGVISKGQLVETDRSGLVAGYMGQTALKTAQVIKKAKGGVLFIDEAYSLSSEEGSNDYGKEAIDTLVKGMEDYRDDLVVIIPFPKVSIASLP